MRVNTATNTLIQIAELNIEYVESFTYPGGIISKTGGTEEDIKSRIGKDRYVFVILKPVWNSMKNLLKTKLTIFNSNVKSVLLYVVRDMEAHQSTRLKTPRFCEHLPTTNPPY